MDIERIVGELRKERERLDAIIMALERLDRKPDHAPTKRGRKFMDKAARLEVSERMKHYWEQRRRAGKNPDTSADGKLSGAARSSEEALSQNPPPAATLGRADYSPTPSH